MSRPARGVRLDSLTTELESRGMSSPQAEELSSEFVQRHPFAQRLGIKRLAKEIESRGLATSSAQGTAAMLIGIELCDRGATFEQVQTELRGLGLETSEALECSLSSSRVYREICSESDLTSATTDTAMHALAWFGLAMFTLSIIARLAP